MISRMSFLGSFTGGEAAAAPEVVSEMTSISNAFAADMGPIHLLPHERAQLRRIRAIMKRDEKLAVNALRVFTRRATMARRALKKRSRAHA